VKVQITDYKNQQILFLERQDLNNIASDFNIYNFANVKLRVQCKGKENVVEFSLNPLRQFVLYNKAQDVDNTFLEKKDFTLIIMTKFQAKQIYSDKICIDETRA